MMADAAFHSSKLTSTSKLDARIAALTDISREDLVADWIKIYKCKPPNGVKRGLLERAVAYRYQTRRYGKLKTETSKALLAIANGTDVEKVRNAPSPKPELKPGTRLVREWHGKTHQVNVTDTGFIWNDQEYASLSAIARAITGAKWSGPRFFGL
jgi:hypothetical protein